VFVVAGLLIGFGAGLMLSTWQRSRRRRRI
jgi:hypothetical protein